MQELIAQFDVNEVKINLSRQILKPLELQLSILEGTIKKDMLYADATGTAGKRKYSLALYFYDLELDIASLNSEVWSCKKEDVLNARNNRIGIVYYLLLKKPNQLKLKNKCINIPLGIGRFSGPKNDVSKYCKIKYKLQSAPKELQHSGFNFSITKKRKKMYPLSPSVYGQIIQNQNNNLKIYLINTSAEEIRFTKDRSSVGVTYYTDASKGKKIAKPDALARAAVECQIQVNSSVRKGNFKSVTLFGAMPNVNFYTSTFKAEADFTLKPNQHLLVEIDNFKTDISARQGNFYIKFEELSGEYDHFTMPVQVKVVADHLDSLKVNGDVTIGGNVQLERKMKSETKTYDLMPIGSIILWSGTEKPDGWEFCDGKNGRPNLQGVFVMGADMSKDQHKVNTKGGAQTMRLDGKHLPIHAHYTQFRYQEYRATASGFHRSALNTSRGTSDREGNGYHDAYGDHDLFIKTKGMITWNDFGQAAPNYFENFNDPNQPAPFDIIPPYHALYYIIRVQ